MVPSGSEEARPFRLTRVPSTTLPTCATRATGGWLTLRRVTLTVSDPAVVPGAWAVNFSVSTESAVTAGAVKLTVAVVAPVSVTPGPETRVHRKETPARSALP